MAAAITTVWSKKGVLYWCDLTLKEIENIALLYRGGYFERQGGVPKLPIRPLQGLQKFLPLEDVDFERTLRLPN